MEAERKAIYLFCFYHIRQGKHLNYHHVLIPADFVEDEEALKKLDGEGYVYYLISCVPVLLTESEAKSQIAKPLIMDGESLWKRLKKNFKNRLPKQMSNENY